MLNYNFSDKYQQNIDWLKNRDGDSVNYRVFGQTLIFQSQLQEFLVLLARRLGCFFTKETLPPLAHLKLSERNGYLILTKPDGQDVLCRHLGEVFFPYLAHIFDDIYKSLTNHVVFHAASVELKGNGLILIGKIGVGKTTLALNMIKNGYSYLADDVSIVKLTPNIQLLPNPQGLKTGRHYITGHGSPHIYKNPADIPYLKISNEVELSGAVLLLHPRNNPPQIKPLDWISMRDALQSRMIPSSICGDSTGKLKDIFSNIPFVLAQPQKGNPSGLVSMIKGWFEGNCSGC